MTDFKKGDKVLVRATVVDMCNEGRGVALKAYGYPYDEFVVDPASILVIDKDLQDYRAAVCGEGPQAYNWKDKPHRLVFDLVELCEIARAKIKELEEERDNLQQSLWEIQDREP